jgi:hypothetical protein
MDDGKLAWRFADCQQFYSFAAVLENEMKGKGASEQGVA